jgi:ATP-dependent Clp protease ATP-binding subunit ClpC
METLFFPLYYRTIGNAVCGTLIGTGMHAIENDLNTLKNHFQEKLKRDYKKLQEFPQPLFETASLKLDYIEYRPMQKIAGSFLPIGESIRLPINVVLGQKYKAMAYQAFLPDFNISFSYFDKRHFYSLLNAFVLNALSEMSLRAIHSLLFEQERGLEILELKIKDNFKTQHLTFNTDTLKSESVLNKYALSFPLKKKTIHQFKLPETAWGLEDKILETVDCITEKRSVIIVGKRASGKTTLIGESIKRIQKNNTDNQRFWQMQIQRITAKSKYLGEWQETIEDLVEELKQSHGVLWLSDFIRLMEIGGEGSEDSLAAFIRPYIADASLKIIGELSPEEYEASKRLLPNFMDLFSVVELEEASPTETMQMLDRLAAYAFEQYKIKIDASALSLSYSMLSRFMPYESFPGKAFKFLGQCFTVQKNSNDFLIDKEQVIKQFSIMSGLPELFLNDNRLLDVAAAVDFFKSKIIGQQEAIDILVSTIKIFKAGLNNPNKPIATLFFSGPSGVGKTSAAKAMADYFFGFGAKKSPLVRLDMSEFQSPSDVYKLLGYGNSSSTLLNEIKERPFSVILLDEIEKANTAIFDLLLNVLDEGRMIDSFGRITDFRNCIIIMTSNLGTKANKISLIGQDLKAEFESSLYSFFRPEFLNRIDAFVQFKALEQKDILEIVKKELNEIGKREGFSKKGIDLKFSNDLLEFFGAYGFDERYGARPIQRAIEQKLIAVLSVWLQSNITFNNGVLMLDFVNNEIEIMVQ